MSDDNITQRLNVEGADLLNLAGVHDANLIELQKQTGARVTLRGDALTITGSQEQVDRAHPTTLRSTELRQTSGEHRSVASLSLDPACVTPSRAGSHAGRALPVSW